MIHYVDSNPVQNKPLSLGEKFLFMLLGIPFSFLGSTYILKFGGNFYPEPFLILWLTLFYIFFKSRFIELSEFVNNKSFYMLIFSVLIISMIGLLRFDADIIDYYARIRAFLLFIIATYIGYYAQRSQNYEVYIKVLFWLSLGVIFFNFIHQFLATYTTWYMQSSTKITFAVLAYVIVIFILLKEENLMYAFFLLLLLIVSSAMSFFRQFYLISFIMTLYFLFFGYFSNKHTLEKKLFIFFIGFIVLLFLVIFSTSIGNVLFEFLSSTDSRYVQSIGKLNDLLNFIESGEVSESEGNRLMGIEYFFNNALAYMLPNGLINDKTFILYSIWGGDTFHIDNVSVIRDSMFAYLIVFFGFIIVLLLFLTANFLTIKSLLGKSRESKSSILLFFIIFWSIFFIDGTLVTQFEKALFTGAIISLAFPRYVMITSSKKKIPSI